MKRKVISTALAAAMLLSMAAPSAYAEDIVVGATAVESTEASAPAETEAAAPAAEATETADTYNAADVPINEENFPDAKFRDYVRKYFDSNKDEVLSADEISNAKKIEIISPAVNSQQGIISSLQGIEYLTALTYLGIQEAEITSLDISKNTELTSLSIDKTPLTSLDVSKNTKLNFLGVAQTPLTSLDVSKNTALTKLSCFKTQLTSLDVSNNIALTLLSCSENQLASLDVSKNTALISLMCNHNQLTSLDVSKNTDLVYLHCNNNQISNLDVSKNTVLEGLWCNDNQLTNLNTPNMALVELRCYNNRLTSLDIHNTNMYALSCSGNPLTSLDVSHNKDLARLECSEDQLTNLDVSNNTALKTLKCHDNQLTSLDVSNNTALNTLECEDNQLTSLDVSNNTDLQSLICKNNCIPMLNLENNKKLFKDSFFFNCSPQTIKRTGAVDVTALVGKANIDRVSDIKTLDNGVEYYYDVKGTYADGTALPKMQVIVGAGTTATSTPVPQTTAKPDQPQSTATPTPTTPTASPEPDATPEPTTPANPDDNNGTGDNDDNNAETPTTPDTTGVEGFVDRLYSVCLSREADAAGQADWVSQLTSYQISGTKAAYGFIFSEEFTNMNYSNADFVEHLYEAFMGRASDEGGKADWVSKLDAGTSREEVFNGFANSVEFDNICKSYGIVSKDIETFVTRLYSVCLDRQPDDAGLADWAGRLRSSAVTGKAAASGFVFSEEFTNKNYSNADYVEHLYAAFMGRASDEAGKTDWVSKLDAGTSREEVFNGFADSAEFDNICSSYGIVRG